MLQKPLTTTRRTQARRPRQLLLAAALSAGLLHPAGAVTLTWDGSTNNPNWSAIAPNAFFGPINNWGLFNPLPSNGDLLVFDGTRGLANNNDFVNLSVASLSFAATAGAFTLTGNSLISTGPITNASNAVQTLNMGITLGADQTWNGGTRGMTFIGAANVGGHALTLTNRTVLNNSSGTMTVGSATANGSLNVLSGSEVNLGLLKFTSTPVSSGAVTVSGAGSRLDVGGLDMLIPYPPTLTSTLDITAGGVVHSSGTRFSAISGALTVSGAGSQLIVEGGDGSGSLFITGTARVSDNGSILVNRTNNAGYSGTIELYNDVGIAPTLTVESGLVKSQELLLEGVVNIIGPSARVETNSVNLYNSAHKGSVNILNGGSLSSSSTINVSRDVLTISGQGSRWENSGNFSTGLDTRVLVDAGGALVSKDFGLDRGTVTVSGEGSKMISTAVLTFDLGTLNLLNGGEAQASVLNGQSYGRNGTINLSGGTLTVGTVNSAGTFNWTSGTLRYTGDATLDTPMLGSTTTLGAGRTLAVTNTLNIASGTVLNLNGGTLEIARATKAGQFNWTSGTLAYTGDASLGDALLALHTTLLTGHTLSVAGSFSVGANASLTLAGGTLTSASALNNAVYLSGYGSIAGSGGFTNDGLLSQMGGALMLANTGANLNNGNWALLAGSQLQLNSGTQLTNAGVMQLNGNLVTGSGTLLNAAAGTVGGSGTIASAVFDNRGTLAVDAGLTRVSNAFNNSGLIALGSQSAVLAGGSLRNSGTLQGLGQVGNAIVNTGLISADGHVTSANSGVLTLNGSVSNSGTLAANAGATLRITAGLARNDGDIQLAGGTFDNNAQALANSGTIRGYGLLRSGTLTNSGSVLLSGGGTAIYADVAATAGSHFVISGGSDASFHGAVDVGSGAEMRVSSGSTATYFGAVAQRSGAILSGTGTSYYEGVLAIGNSPGFGANAGDVVFADSNVYIAEIGGGTACTGVCTGDAYDRYAVAGQLTLGGTLKLVSWNGFVAQAGQHFDLLDWGSLRGGFTRIDTQDLVLAAGTELDLSQLSVSGEISVAAITAVPEPGSWALMAAGLGLLGWRSRRFSNRVAGARPRPCPPTPPAPGPGSGVPVQR